MSLGLFFNEKGFDSGISTKELIVRILCEEWPLSVRQIHERMKRTHAVDCTYQAAFKQVKELAEKGVILNEDRQYQMNLEWLERVGFFIQNLLEYYEKNPSGVIGGGNRFNHHFGRGERNLKAVSLNI